jgi:hypothetical protein
MKKTFDAGLERPRLNKGARRFGSRNTMETREDLPDTPQQAGQRTSPHDQPQQVDPRIFSRVYSHIAQHRGTADAGVLVDLIWAISLDHSAGYFKTLEGLEPCTRDLGLELLKAKLYGAFPPDAWEDAYQFAKQLNQPTNDQVSTQNSIVREAINEQQPPLTSRVARHPKREAREPAESFGISAELAATAAAATVIGLFVLVVAWDERVLGSRFEIFAPMSWRSESVESPPQIQKPVLAGVDATESVTPMPEGPAKTEHEGTSEQYESSLPAEEQESVIEDTTSVEDPKISIAPSLTSASESGVPENSSLAQGVPLAPPPQEPAVEQTAPAAIASEPPKPIQRAVPQKAKSDSKVRSKSAKPSLAKRPVRPSKPPTVETVEPVASQPQSKTAVAPPVAEPPAKAASENPAPSATAAEPVSETVSASAEKRGSDSVAVPARFEPGRDASQTQEQEKVITNPSFVERLMGFKPGDRIARMQPGKRATQPHFIRQLENIDTPAEHASGADVETD